MGIVSYEDSSSIKFQEIPDLWRSQNLHHPGNLTSLVTVQNIHTTSFIEFPAIFQMGAQDEKPVPAAGLTDLSHYENGNVYADEHAAGLVCPKVTWYKNSGLIRLYIMMPVLFLGSTVNGYDGSLLNGLQTMDTWSNCKCFESLV